MSKARRIAAWVLIGLIGALLVMGAVMKIAGPPPVVEGFAKMGLADWRIAIGAVELLTAVLLLIPRTHSLGLLLLTAYLGGAIATHLQQEGGPQAIPAAVTLALAWIAGLLRHPELLVSFRKPGGDEAAVGT